MRSNLHLPGVWSKISFDYGKSPGTGIVPLSTYQTKSCERASSRSMPRTSHKWWHFNVFEDGPNTNGDYLLSLFNLFAVQLLRLVPISTTKNSANAPKHSSCYAFTDWSTMLWDVSFSLGAVQLLPQWDQTLALVHFWTALFTELSPLISRSLCYDIRLQVTLSRLVSLAKCCSEQFGCHQSASVFCYQYPLSSFGISVDGCAKQLCDAHKISMLTTPTELVEDTTFANLVKRYLHQVCGDVALSLSVCVPSLLLHMVHQLALAKCSCPRSCGPRQQSDRVHSPGNVTSLIDVGALTVLTRLWIAAALRTMSNPRVSSTSFSAINDFRSKCHLADDVFLVSHARQATFSSDAFYIQKVGHA